MDLTTEGNSALLKRLEEMQKRIDRNERERELAEAERRGFERGREESWALLKRCMYVSAWIAGAVGTIIAAAAKVGVF